MSKKPSMGRKKIEMKKIDSESSLQVTFSKRRNGVFKKASELTILSGAETAIVIFSPAGKAFSFGHPSVDSVIDKYLAQSNPPPDEEVQIPVSFDPYRKAIVSELNQQQTEVLNLLEAEKKRGEALKQSMEANRNGSWWEAPMDDMSLSELEQLAASLEELKTNVTKRADELSIQTSYNPLPPFVGMSSEQMLNPQPFVGMNSVQMVDGLSVQQAYNPHPFVGMNSDQMVPQPFVGMNIEQMVDEPSVQAYNPQHFVGMNLDQVVDPFLVTTIGNSTSINPSFEAMGNDTSIFPSFETTTMGNNPSIDASFEAPTTGNDTSIFPSFEATTTGNHTSIFPSFEATTGDDTSTIPYFDYDFDLDFGSEDF